MSVTQKKTDFQIHYTQFRNGACHLQVCWFFNKQGKEAQRLETERKPSSFEKNQLKDNIFRFSCFDM